MKTLLLIVTPCLFLIPIDQSCAQSMVTGKKNRTSQRLYDQGVPEQGYLTLKTDQYTLPIDAASGWTIEKMLYRGKTFGLNNGHYGTVLRPQNGNWWGTGHTEGGREIVHALTLNVDGKKVPITENETMGKTISGKKIELHKQSTIWKFKAKVEIVITNDHIIERTKLVASEECETNLIYYFMHCFPPTTTKWLAQLPDGSFEEGLLKASRTMKLAKVSRWVAQYDAKTHLGLLCYTPQLITGKNSKGNIWDLDRYHKYYLCQNFGQKFKKGEKLDFTLIVKAVPNETGDWKATRKAASLLMKNFPPEK